MDEQPISKCALSGGGEGRCLANDPEGAAPCLGRGGAAQQRWAPSTHASLGFFSSSLYKITVPESLAEEEAATVEGPFPTGWGKRGSGGAGVWVLHRGGWGRRGLPPACPLVYICTYTLRSTCTVDSHACMCPRTRCLRGPGSTGVRMGRCIAYIFTCTISRCV